MRKFINGYDFKESFGIEITNGSNMVFQMPEIKPYQIQNDFDDEDGFDQITVDPKFAARTFTFDCTMAVATMSDFKIKYWKLFTVLKQGGGYTYYDEFTNSILYVNYQKQLNLSSVYRTNKDEIGMTFQLQFGEDNPFDNIPLIELVNESNAVLVP